MNVNVKELLALLQGRQPAESRYGIGSADAYLKLFEPCFTGEGACPFDAFGIKSPEEWQNALTDAASRMTYCAPDLIVKDVRSSKSLPHQIAEMDHVLTSTKTDRDGDVMESAGANIDDKMPLLWHHNILMPVGKYLGTTLRNEKIILGKSAIFDTSLGRDTAVLCEGGALRISHGFLPTEAEPIFNAAKAVTGVHIKKFDVMEVSVVSVPSNTDAIITSFSRKKLHDPLVMKWAKGYFDSRKRSFPGFSVLELEQKGDSEHGCKGAAGCECEKCKATASASDPGQKGDTVVTSHSVSQQGTGTPGINYAMKCSKCDTAFSLTGVPEGMDLTKVSCPACGGSAVPTENAGKSATPTASDPGSTPKQRKPKVGTKVGRTYSSRTKKKIAELHGHVCNAHSASTKIARAAGLIKDDDDSSKSILAKLETKMLGGMSDHIEGSFEWVGEKLAYSLNSFLSKQDDNDRYYGVVATFPGYALVAGRKYTSRGVDVSHMRVNWSLNGEGVPEWSGEPESVKVSVNIEKKSLDMAIRAFQVRVGASAADGIKALGAAISAVAVGLDVEDGIKALEQVKGSVSETLGLLVDERDEAEIAAVL